MTSLWCSLTRVPGEPLTLNKTATRKIWAAWLPGGFFLGRRIAVSRDELRIEVTSYFSPVATYRIDNSRN